MFCILNSHKKTKLYSMLRLLFLDSSNTESLKRKISLPKNIDFDELRFYLGIDDRTNDAGIYSGHFDSM